MLDTKWLQNLLLLAIVLIASLLFGTTFVTGKPFVIYGKEFGYGSEEQRKKEEQLSAMLTQATQQIQNLQSENLRLKQQNEAFQTQQKKRDDEANTLWFPVDDVTFYEDGSFITKRKKSGKGQWSDPESEVSLRLLDWGGEEVMLGTNLSAPANKFLFRTGRGIVQTMDKWRYRIMILNIKGYDHSTEVRIERTYK